MCDCIVPVCSLNSKKLCLNVTEPTLSYILQAKHSGSVNPKCQQN